MVSPPAVKLDREIREKHEKKYFPLSPGEFFPLPFSPRRRWMKDSYRVVEIAFREKPQLKEKVGIVVPYLD